MPTQLIQTVRATELRSNDVLMSNSATEVVQGRLEGTVAHTNTGAKNTTVELTNGRKVVVRRWAFLTVERSVPTEEEKAAAAVERANLLATAVVADMVTMVETDLVAKLARDIDGYGDKLTGFSWSAEGFVRNAARQAFFRTMLGTRPFAEGEQISDLDFVLRCVRYARRELLRLASSGGGSTSWASNECDRATQHALAYWLSRSSVASIIWSIEGRDED